MDEIWCTLVQKVVFDLVHPFDLVHLGAPFFQKVVFHLVHLKLKWVVTVTVLTAVPVLTAVMK